MEAYEQEFLFAITLVMSLPKPDGTKTIFVRSRLTWGEDRKSAFEYALKVVRQEAKLKNSKYELHTIIQINDTKDGDFLEDIDTDFEGVEEYEVIEAYPYDRDENIIRLDDTIKIPDQEGEYIVAGMDMELLSIKLVTVSHPNLRNGTIVKRKFSELRDFIIID